jgi:transposase InsO family protein
MHNLKEAEHRLRTLIFWEKYGDSATKEAFKVSRRTLYRWQRAFTRGEGKIQALDKRSTAPIRRRTRRPPPELLERIITLRREHHRLGKKPIAHLLSITESTAGRILSDLKKRNLLPQYRKLSWYAKSGMFRERERRITKKHRRPKEYKRGIEIDTIVRFIHGTKRYIYTAIDIQNRFAFGGAYTNHSSESAADFLTKLIDVAPFRITEIQTDNGSEFAHLFHALCEKRHIRHYHTYPRCPQMNGTIERFNRTISDDFISRYRMLLKEDLSEFNHKLVDWLLWYNTERPHQSLGMLAPLQYYVKSLPRRECQMWWTRTAS